MLFGFGVNFSIKITLTPLCKAVNCFYFNELSFLAKNECVELRVDGISRAVGTRSLLLD